MAENAHRRLLDSNRWVSFLESTALGLQVNLTLLHPGMESPGGVPAACPSCGGVYPCLTPGEIAKAINAGSENPGELTSDCGVPAVAMPIRGGFCVMARECTFCREAARPPLLERAGIAQRLLSSFQTALNEGFEGGQRAMELSTLRQMNHIVLTLIQGENDALERAFNLILSALIILLDARGSWLEYKSGDIPVLLVKGDREAVVGYREYKDGPVSVVDLHNGSVHGRIGVLQPADTAKAAALLPLMAQECAIVFEIDHLFKLVQNRLTRVLGAMGSAVLLVDRNGNINYANKAAGKMLGEKVSILIGRPAASVSAPWTALLSAGVGWTARGQMELLGQGPEARWVDWQISPLLDGDSIAGWVVLADDRTEYYRWQEAARQAERFATTAAMVGALAHELRNPLSAARGLLQLMGRKREPEQIRGYTDLVLREIDRVARLLNEFLLLGRPADMALEPLEPVSFLQELMPLLEGEASLHGVEITTDIETVPSVTADPGQMTQVVLNLVRNALEAAGHGGQVILALRKETGGVVFAVRDNGPGLSPEVRKKLFQPFFTTKERGTGLGLPVIQAIVKNHGGQITADNLPGGGAEFIVLLPATGGPTMESYYVSIIMIMADDLLRYPCEQALRAIGFSVFSFANFADSFLVAKRYNPKILVLEQPVLGINDIEDVNRAWPGVRVLVVGEPEDLKKVKSLKFLPAPVDYTRLVNKIRYMLNSSI